MDIRQITILDILRERADRPTKKMNVLIACEESQRVCSAFREKGHNAFSCDIQECSGGHPEWHIKGDVLEILNPEPKYDFNDYIVFNTMDGREHWIEGKWDMIIAHPPCTYLSNAGVARLYPRKGELNMERYQKGLEAKEFFMQFYNADCPRIVIENPIPTRIFALPPYTQTIQPYEHGEPYSKKTCLWIIGDVPKLIPTNEVEPICSWVSGGSKDNNGNKRKNCGTTFRDSKTRSKTFEGIAKAMAEQWGVSQMDSIIQKDDSKCFICHSRQWLEWHHVFGAALKKKSEKYGLMVRLCHYCHNEHPNGVHQNKERRLALQRHAQRKAMERYKWTIEDFIKEFYKNYL